MLLTSPPLLVAVCCWRAWFCRRPCRRLPTFRLTALLRQVALCPRWMLLLMLSAVCSMVRCLSSCVAKWWNMSTTLCTWAASSLQTTPWTATSAAASRGLPTPSIQTLQPVLRNRHLSARTKCTLYRAIVVNNLVYGSEAWVPKASQMRRLDVFHLRCLRHILGVSRLDHVTNRAILLKAKTDSVDVIARRYRLRWLGHVGRMRSADPLPDGRWQSDRVPLRLLSAWMDGPRPVGRPPKPWGQQVAGDIVHCALPAGA